MPPSAPPTANPLDLHPSYSEEPKVISENHPHPNKKKIIALVLGLVLLLAGIGTAIYLVQQQQRPQIGAWYCNQYSFSVDRSGNVTVSLAADYPNTSEPKQAVVIKINGQTATVAGIAQPSLEAPAVNRGQTIKFVQVDVPPDGFSWEVVGQTDCRNSGTFAPLVSPTPAACVPYPLEITPVSGTWNQPDKFTYKNTTTKDVTVTRILDCWPEGEQAKLCKDSTVTYTLKPGESKTEGFGKICSKWQIDFQINSCSERGFVAEASCSTPTATPSPTRRPSPSPSPTTPPIGGPDPTPTTAPTSTPKPGPTSTPGPTGVPDPTATPIVPRASTPTPTPVVLPESGAADYTLMLGTGSLIILGLASLLFAL